MFIFLSKFIPPFFYPLGLVCLLVGLALFATRRPRLQRISLLVALLILLLAGNRWVAMGLTRSLEWRYLPPDKLPSADVIVLLGGGTQSAQYPRPLVEVNSAGDRLIYAAWLYQQGVAAHILVSGGGIEWMSSGSSPAVDMAVLLGLLGVPEGAIWLEPDSRNTYENALNSRIMLDARGIRRVVLVTSAAHMPRSVALFERQGLEVIPAPADFRVTQAGWQKLTSGSPEAQMVGLLPSAENLAITTSALKEYLGILVYRLRGWL